MGMSPGAAKLTNMKANSLYVVAATINERNKVYFEGTYDECQQYMLTTPAPWYESDNAQIYHVDEWNDLQEVASSWQSYKGVSWDSQDLESAKQAANILWHHEMVSEEEMNELNFGGLDVWAAVED